MQKKGELVVVHTYKKVVKFWFWQNRLYVRTPFHVSRGKILHFKQPRLFAVNRMATRTFREKKQQQSRIFFLDRILMSTLTWITEKDVEREIINNGE